MFVVSNFFALLSYFLFVSPVFPLGLFFVPNKCFCYMLIYNILKNSSIQYNISCKFVQKNLSLNINCKTVSITKRCHYTWYSKNIMLPCFGRSRLVIIITDWLILYMFHSHQWFCNDDPTFSYQAFDSVGTNCENDD